MSIVRMVGNDGLTPENVNDFKSLTFETGNEHALVTLSTGENAIVSGGPGVSFSTKAKSQIFSGTLIRLI
jgi:hypothetical protein